MKRMTHKSTYKNYLIKTISVCIGLLYLVQPLHQQINDIIHEVSHQLSAPDNLIAHDKINHHLNDFHQHAKKEAFKHDHRFLSFINIFLKHLDFSDTTNDSLHQKNLKLKHFYVVYQYIFKPVLAEYHEPHLAFLDSKTSKGFFIKSIDPPDLA